MTFLEWLLEQRSGGSIMYHGTASKFLGSVMSSGLDPNPKKRSWDSDEGGFFNASRKSIGGIYVTNNLMTASSAAFRTAQKTNSNRLYVVMDLHPNSLIGDEDDFMVNAKVTSSEYQLATLHANAVLLKSPKFVQEVSSQEYGESHLKWMRESYENAKSKFIDFALGMIENKLGGMHSSLRGRLRQLYESGFDVCLARQAAHLDSYTFKKGFWDATSGLKAEPFMPAQPSKQEAEDAYLAFQDRVTRSAKQVAYKNPDKFSHTARLMEPIGFHGKNRIICVVEEIIDREGGGFKSKGLKVHYGRLPEKFLDEWRRSMGEINIIR